MAHPGIILAVAATVIYNLGFICEKRALDRLPAIEAHRLGHLVRTLFTAPAWLAGFLLICCGLMLQVLVLSLEPLTVAQPLQASGVVVTILFSRLILHERLGRAELTCIGIIAVAVGLLSLSNGHGPGAEAGTHAAGAAIAAAAIPACLAVPAIYYLANRAPGRRHRHRRELRLLRRADLRVRRGGTQGTVGIDILDAARPRRAARRGRRVALPLRGPRILRDRHVPVPGSAPAQPGFHRHADFPRHQHRVPGRHRFVAVPRAVAGQPGPAGHAAGRRRRRHRRAGHPDHPQRTGRHPPWLRQCPYQRGRCPCRARPPKGGPALPARPEGRRRAPRT
jgi:multidrug transporter EmrE-like cation transporter